MHKFGDRVGRGRKNIGRAQGPGPALGSPVAPVAMFACLHHRLSSILTIQLSSHLQAGSPQHLGVVNPALSIGKTLILRDTDA